MGDVLITAGENSGDKYGAALVRAFKRTEPETRFFGVGGQHMAAEGVEILHPLDDLAVVGLVETAAHLPRIRRLFSSLLRQTRSRKPAAAVLIDSPDFNLRLARKLKRMSIPILYYISPTVWAWRKNRLRTIRRSVSEMMLIFPFEEKIYEKAGVPAVFVGHPLVERVRPTLGREAFLRKHGLDPGKKIISLLPGSRKGEVRSHMPVLTAALPLLRAEDDFQFLLIRAENIDPDFLRSFIPPGLEGLRIVDEDTYDALAASELALSSCGTATLEAALLETPVVAFYRLSPLTYGLGRFLVRIRSFSIVNILAGDTIIPEVIQKRFRPEILVEEARKILDSAAVRKRMIVEFRKIRASLGEKKASENAARRLLSLIQATARDSNPGPSF